MPVKHKTLFPDTNYFLHYPPIDQVDWLEAAGAESVLICVCMQVIHELDIKTHDPRLKDRAKRVIKELRNIRKDGNMVQPKVTLEFLSEDTRDEFFRPALNPKNNDDRILQCILNRKEAFPHEEMELISDDFGMEIKCENLNIKILKPNPAKKLPDLVDAQLKQLKEAQYELEKHKNALPNLTLSLKGENDTSSSYFRFNLPSSSPVNIDIEMKNIRSRYPLRAPDDEIPTSLLAMQFLGSISKREYDRYNAELEEFFCEYESYLKVCELMRQTKESSFGITLTLDNDGHSPAHQIDIHIHFPDGMVVLDADHLPPGFKDRKPPDPPTEPLREIGKVFSIEQLRPPFANSELPNFRMPDLSRTEPNVSSPQLIKTSGYDIRFEVKKLKHGYSIELGKLMILFPSREEAKSFSAAYQITADNHPKSQDGQLHFVLETKTVDRQLS
jgi:hypothetical protein